MESIQIAIIDTGAANIGSVKKAVDYAFRQRSAAAEDLKLSALITSEPKVLLESDAAVLPGVGANDSVMRSLKQFGTEKLPSAIREFAGSGRPLLCVCIGMQILMETSDEGELAGLGMIRGSVKRLRNRDETGERLKIPHMGWNSVRFKQENPDKRHRLFQNIPQDTHFYFVHSFHCEPDEDVTAAETQYGQTVCAAVTRSNIVGTQFHPEKSGRWGIKVYENFIEYAEEDKRGRTRH